MPGKRFAKKLEYPSHPKTVRDKGVSVHSYRHETSLPALAVLQHQIGNRAVLRAIEQGILPTPAIMRQEKETTELPEGEEEKVCSGAFWVDEFPYSTEVSDLDSSFSDKVTNFITALEEAGADVTVTSTLRPPERAYLMHWAWMIAKKGSDPRKVPAMKGVDIEWWHGDKETSRAAAQEMVDGYEINKLKIPPSLKSYHIVGKAIDMTISWSGELTIRNAKGIEIPINSAPRDHTNRQLIAVGRSYQVIHFKDVDKDKVHWSVNGH